MFRNYYFIVNPVAGGGKKLEIISELQRFCRKHSMDFTVVMTHKPKEATELARTASEKYEAVIAVGGDGTVNEVVNGISGTQAKLGILPIGSGNDYAKMIGLSKNLKKDLKVLRKGTTRMVDAGKVNNKYFFINAFGAGFDGEVSTCARKYLKLSHSFFGYLITVLKTLMTYRFRKATITIDGTIVTDKKIFLVACGIGSTYGGGFQIAPRARIDDGLFDICIIDKTSRWNALRIIPKIMRGKHEDEHVVHVHPGKEVVIKTDRKIASQLDGEIIEPTKELRVMILQHHIQLITP